MRRDAFRKRVEAEVISYGYAPGSYVWQPSPARLLISVGGVFQQIPIKTTMKKTALAYELGRLKGWAEALDLKAPQPRKTDTRQIDLEEAIAAA